MAETNLQLKVTQAGAGAVAADLQKVADAQSNVGATVDMTAKMAAAAKPAMEALVEAQQRLAGLRGQRQQALQTGTVGEVADFTEKITEQERSIRSLVAVQAEMETNARNVAAAENAAATAAQALTDAQAEQASAEAADAARAEAEALKAFAAEAEAAQSAVQALAEAQAKLNELRAQRETARESGTVGEVLQLNDAIGEQEQKVSALGGEMGGLNIASRDYAGLLSQIDPRLGTVALSLSRASRLAGEFGISLTTVGLVVGAIYAVGKAVAYATEQLEKATEATKKYEDATKEFLKVQRDVQQTIETISDKRREGGMTAEQARGARTTAASIKGKYGADLDEGAVDEAVGMLAGTGASPEDMAQAAFLSQSGYLELDAKAPPESRMRALRRAQQRRRGVITGFERRVSVQKSEAAQEAAKQAVSSGGLELDEAVRESLGPGTPEDDTVIRGMRAFKSLGELDVFEEGGKRIPTKADVRTQFNTEERGRIRQTFINVINHNQNQRHIGSDGRSQRGRMDNGEVKVKSFEGWGP